MATESKLPQPDSSADIWLNFSKESSKTAW